jgi:hypothetical protein
MRRSISIILAAVLVTTPLKVVLAQADQQELQVTATDVPSVVPPRTDQTPVRIGVPVVEPNSGAALLFTAAMRDTTGCLEHSHACFATTHGYFGPQAAARKSPVLAGALSFLVPFGTGSFYAGNSGHGVRHLVIGGVALSGMVVIGNLIPDGCDAACTEFDAFFVAFGVLFLNQVVGTVVAVIDANHFNRDVGSAAFSVSPTFTVVGREASGNGIATTPTEQVGVRLLQFSF